MPLATPFDRAIRESREKGECRGMLHRILVIFENRKVHRPAVLYARELALRMDAEVTFLTIAEMAFAGGSLLGSNRHRMRRIEEEMGAVLGAFAADFLKDGISAGVALRVGDAAQELLKFLAERPPFQTILWGSSAALPETGPGRRAHWIIRVAGNLECPLMAVAGRSAAVQPAGKTETT